ncbi:MAG: RNA 2',3'-cyclic phosphodiesterase [Rhodovibrionaceae bacterium]
MRLFVALSLPEEIRERLAMMASGLPAARWVKPENYHITLRFVGEVDNGLASDIDDALSGVHMPEFELSLAGIGQFGEGRKLRSVWAGVEGGEPLIRLQTKVENAVARAGVAPEGRKFKPHVTLARFKDSPGAKFGEYLHSHGLFRSQPFMVRDFVLYSSFLAREGAIYRPEAVYELDRA